MLQQQDSGEQRTHHTAINIISPSFYLSQEIAVVSLNGFIHCWDAGRMKQLMSKRLPHTMENVCLATDEDCQMYAVGSKVGFSTIYNVSWDPSVTCSGPH